MKVALAKAGAKTKASPPEGKAVEEAGKQCAE